MSQPLASGSVQPAPRDEPRRALAVVKDYIAITKPKHQVVLLTCWATMTLAGGAPFGVYLYVLFATALGVASSHVFNQLIDSDIDAKMSRTNNRPLAAQRISRTGAVLFGTLLGVISVALMLWRVNLLTALLVVAGWVIYVPIYTWWLKRSTPWCTFFGGASGAIPTLIGWSAVTGRLDVIPFLLFMFMMIWQTPHFFALSLFRGEEYQRAGVPMLVVVSGVSATLKQILGYTLAMIAFTLLLYPAGAAGIGYLATALLTGGAYLAAVIVANVRGEAQSEMWGRRLFLWSYPYMAAIFVSVAVDHL